MKTQIPTKTLYKIAHDMKTYAKTILNTNNSKGQQPVGTSSLDRSTCCLFRNWGSATLRPALRRTRSLRTSRATSRRLAASTVTATTAMIVTINDFEEDIIVTQKLPGWWKWKIFRCSFSWFSFEKGKFANIFCFTFWENYLAKRVVILDSKKEIAAQ